MARKTKQTPMQQAVMALFDVEPASGEATPEQMLEIAQKFGVEVYALEGFYLEAVDKQADA